jgi:zinc resistance-associated protein
MEELMKKIFAAGVAALALLGTQPAFAQQGPSPDGPMPGHPPFSAADMKALTEAKIAALRVGLELTPEQEKNWAPVEQSVRAIEESARARRAKMHELLKSEDGIAVLRARAEAMEQRAADLKKLADAAEPLYRMLSDEQKRRLHFLIGTMMLHRQPHRPGSW